MKILRLAGTAALAGRATDARAQLRLQVGGAGAGGGPPHREGYRGLPPAAPSARLAAKLQGGRAPSGAFSGGIED